ncbi:casein kinase II subunit alpha [Nematocida sp. AWRm78]|nr:casein kinase II subunit alpha [Nematocida sp. AWRm79]KAI5185470.1 casein kinase II subunit alpha [Nematocida sp. AWRm78]
MVLEPTPRVYVNNALKRGKAYYEYADYTIEYGDIERYKITDFLGRGKYSQVFKGREERPNSSKYRECVIKVLRPIREKKINREIKILKSLVNIENVIHLLDVVRDSETNTRSLIFPYEDHTEARALFKIFTHDDIVYYMHKLLSTLDEIHAMGIFHRDLKPQNIIINHKTRVLKIIDWGLAEYYLPNTEYATRVASLHFKAPELLLGYRYYDYSLDIWSAGCILGEMIFNRTPLFNGNSNEDQLEKIIRVCGVNQLKSYMEKYKLTHPANQLEKIYSTCPPENSWASVQAADIRVSKKSHQRDGLIALLKDMLMVDHRRRPSAKGALGYEVFSCFSNRNE